MGDAASARGLVQNQLEELVDITSTVYTAEGLMHAILVHYSDRLGSQSMTIKRAIKMIGGRHTKSTAFTTWVHATGAIRLVDVAPIGKGTAASPDFAQVLATFPGVIEDQCTDGFAIVGNSVKLLLHLR